MIPVDLPRARELSDEHGAAIEEGPARIGRAFRDSDWPAAVGAAKEICETIAKVVLAARHAEMPSDYPSLISAAHRTLDRLPGTGTAGETPVKEMSPAARKLATALARLRNDFGTGHGRPVLPPTTEEHAALAVDGAIVWCRWALTRLDTVLSNTVDRLISELDSGEVFHAGVLADRLLRLDMESLLDEDSAGPRRRPSSAWLAAARHET